MTHLVDLREISKILINGECKLCNLPDVADQIVMNYVQ